MDKPLRLALGAFAGWLLVGVADALPRALFGLLNPMFHLAFPPLTWVGQAVALVGWLATVVFGGAVLFEVWQSLRRAG